MSATVKIEQKPFKVFLSICDHNKYLAVMPLHFAVQLQGKAAPV